MEKPELRHRTTRSRRRYVASQVIFIDINYDGPANGSPQNTELVDSDEPDTIHDANCAICTMDTPHESNHGGPEEPERTKPTNQDLTNQEEP